MNKTPLKENSFPGVSERSPVSGIARPMRSTPDRGRFQDAEKKPGLSTPTRLPRPGSATGQYTPKQSEGIPDKGERVHVFVRIRPPRDGEVSGYVRASDDGKSITVVKGTGSSTQENQFEFDEVLAPVASQQDVYTAAVSYIVDDVLDGYNGTVMAYGQTGAGKTYTLSNVEPDAIGMIPRALADIFIKIRNDPLHDYVVLMSYIQIYMEQIKDLLNPDGGDNLQLRENDSGVFVAGVKEVDVNSMDECLRLLSVGDRNRLFAVTDMNAHSSRSHAIVMLTVVKRRRLPPGLTETQTVKVGKLFLVDLAGSERLKKSGSTGLRAEEAKSINLSLTGLGMCINARADKNSTHVPFRASKLTRLLQESLGGNAKTSLVLAVADAREHVDETLQTLQFGSRAIRVKMQPIVNECADYAILGAALLAQLDSRTDEDPDMEAFSKHSEALTSVQKLLKVEKERNQAIMDKLQLERESAEEERKQLREQLKKIETDKKMELRDQVKVVREQQRMLEQSQKDIDKLQAELDQVKEEKGRKESQLKEVAGSKDQLQQQLAARDAAYANLEAEMAKLRSTAAELQVKLAGKAHEAEVQRSNASLNDGKAKDLQKQLICCQEECDALASKLAVSQADVLQHAQTINQLQRTLDDHRKVEASLKGEVDCLQHVNSDLKEQVLSTKAALSSKERVIDELQHKQALQNNALDQCQVLTERFKSQVEQEEQHIQNLKATLSAKERVIEELEHKQLLQKSTLDQCEIMNDRLKSQVEQQEQHIQHLKAECCDKGRGISDLEHKAKRSEDLLSQTKALLQESQQEASGLKAHLSRSLQELEDLKRSKARLTEETMMLTAAHEKLQHSVEDLEVEIAVATADISGKVKQLSELQAREMNLQTLVQQLKSEIELLKADVAAKKGEIAELRAAARQRDQLIGDKDEVLTQRSSTIEQLNADVRDLKSTLADRVKDVAQHAQSEAKLKAVLDETNVKLATRARHVEKLEAEITDFKRKVELLLHEKAQLKTEVDQSRTAHEFDKVQWQKSAGMDREVMVHRHKLILEEMNARIKRHQDDYAELKERMTDEVNKRNDRLAILSDDVKERQDTVLKLQSQMRDLSQRLLEVQNKNQKLSLHCSKLEMGVKELQKMNSELEESLNAEHEYKTVMEHQLQSAVKSRNEFTKVWLVNRMRNGAARTIQRCFRLHLLQRNKTLLATNEMMLLDAKDKVDNLQRNNAHLQQKHSANLAFLGKLMMKNSMISMRDSAEALTTAFVVAQKDLRSRSTVSQRFRNLATRSRNQSRSQSFYGSPFPVSEETPNASVQSSPVSSPRAEAFDSSGLASSKFAAR